MDKVGMIKIQDAFGLDDFYFAQLTIENDELEIRQVINNQTAKSWLIHLSDCVLEDDTLSFMDGSTVITLVDDPLELHVLAYT